MIAGGDEPTPDGTDPGDVERPDDDAADRFIVAGWPVTLPMAAVAGLAVGVLGTAVHRAVPPWGLALALASVLSGAVLARGLAGGVGLATLGGALLLVTQAANTFRPGGDLIIVGDGLGYAWLLGSALTCAGVAFLPVRWFTGSG